MGIQTGALSIRGRVGNVVGYSYLDSKNRKAAGMRIYQGQVKNPNTNAQIRQRARLLPLVNFYRVMSAIIKRGMQEVAYGQPSRRVFMSANMRNFSGPWLTKGTLAAVPGPFVIAKGSLVPTTVTSISDTLVTTDLSVGGSTAPTTIGALSTLLIANNTDVREGDQLTFVCVVKVGSAENYVYRVVSIVVSTSDSTPLPFTITPAADGSVAYSIGLRADEIVAAGAVIQSRDGEGNTHLRSFAQLVVNPNAVGQWFGDASLSAAIASYKASTGNNDWPVEAFDGNVASSPLVIDGVSYVGLAVIDGYANLYEANNVARRVKNTNEYSKNVNKFLGPSSWIDAQEGYTGGIVEVDYDSYNTLVTWLVRNYGYTLGEGGLEL